jgi:hypothetical protein
MRNRFLPFFHSFSTLYFSAPRFNSDKSDDALLTVFISKEQPKEQPKEKRGRKLLKEHKE